MSLPVAVLAGGLGARLGSISRRIPKALVEVAGRPFAVHQIELLRRHGLTDIVFVVGHLGDMVRDELRDGSQWGVRLKYVFDGPARLGTGGAIRHALPCLADPFFVLYGDSYLECDYAAIEHAFLDSGRRGLMTVFRNDNKWDGSNVVFESGHVVQYDKINRTAEMRHIDYGLGVFRHAAFADRMTGEAFDLTTVYQSLLAHGELAGFEVSSRFYEIGSTLGLEETSAHLARKEFLLR